MPTISCPREPQAAIDNFRKQGQLLAEALDANSGKQSEQECESGDQRETVVRERTGRARFMVLKEISL